MGETIRLHQLIQAILYALIYYHKIIYLLPPLLLELPPDELLPDELLPELLDELLLGDE